MKYINPTLGKYAASTEALMAHMPNTSFPPGAFELPDGWLPVALTDKPVYEAATQFCVEIPPALIDGIWYQQWSVAEMFDDEGAKAVARAAAQAVADEVARAAAKKVRTATVAALKVTTTAGNQFDADETSQTRMARAIIALGTGLAPSVNWVLADNTVIAATATELTEALVLAGQAQAAVWVV